MSEMKNGTQASIAIRSGSLPDGTRYREAGTGAVPVICLGGGEALSPMRARLAAHHRIVDLIPSAPSAGAISPALAAIGADRFDLIAHGASAAPALQLALDRPNEIRSLILLAPTALTLDGQPNAGVDAALVERLGTLKTPILACFGTKDSIAPVEAARHYRERIPGCNLVLIYDAGQGMETERPEAVASLVLDFLERRDLFLVRRESDLIFP